MLTVAFAGYQGVDHVRTAWTLLWWDEQNQLMEEKINSHKPSLNMCAG